MAASILAFASISDTRGRMIDLAYREIESLKACSDKLTGAENNRTENNRGIVSRRGDKRDNIAIT